jgi:hypothetical protein
MDRNRRDETSDKEPIPIASARVADPRQPAIVVTAIWRYRGDYRLGHVAAAY